MKRRLFFCCLAFSLQSYGAAPQVPSTIRFANITLHLSKEAKKRIQEKVDSLTRNEKYFQTILDRANLFLPIIERVLKEENLPLDFRYLVMQESALVADAVSTAKPAAREVGLKIDRNVDERMHITAATRAAARYLKQHNRVFDNWLYALVAYNEGRVGARRFIQKHYLGANKMNIEQQAHVYIIHFLAYKVAFEQVLGKDGHPELYLYEYQEVHGKNLNEIAQELGVDVAKVKDYNKWLKRYRVPRGTTCAAVVPMTHRQYASQGTLKKKDALAKNNIDYVKYWEKAENFPTITCSKGKKNDAKIVVINDIAGVVALEGDSAVSLAKAGRISLTKFLAFNDLDKSCSILPGQVYYYRPKHSRASIYFHIARSGETWWSVAQKYGIKQKALLHKNRLRKEVALEAGRVLWLRFIRPTHLSVTYAHHPARVSAPKQK
jgi:membrane-bound lytic murein transglycosylase D